eukprot:408868-Hanusia_phi.AAC.2
MISDPGDLPRVTGNLPGTAENLKASEGKHPGGASTSPMFRPRPQQRGTVTQFDPPPMISCFKMITMIGPAGRQNSGCI